MNFVLGKQYRKNGQMFLFARDALWSHVLIINEKGLVIERTPILSYNRETNEVTLGEEFNLYK